MKRALFAVVCMAISIQLYSQKIGLQLYSLREQFKTDVPGTLAKVKSWNIQWIEGGGTYDMPMEAYQKLLAQNGLKMVSVGADFDELADHPQTAVDNAKAFGAKYVVCYWIPHQGDEFTIDNTKKAVEVFNKAGKLLRENGLSLCYHPHGYEFRPYEGGTLFDYLAQQTNPKYFNFEMDVFWIKHPGQDPVALLKKHPKRFLLLHLKDRKPGTPGNQNGHADVESNVVLGTGDVGIEEIMKAVKKTKVKYAFIEDESSQSVTQIPQSLLYLKKISENK